MTTSTTTHPEPLGPTAPVSPATVPHRFGGVTLALGGVTLLTGLFVVPGPWVADIGTATWVPGHALNLVGYLLLVVGFPAVIASFGERLRWPGFLGYAALMMRFALSSGSHLYSMWLLPQLAAHQELLPDLTAPAPLASIYDGHNDLINVVLATGTLGLVWALWRYDRGLRVPAVVLAAGAGCQAISNPLALLLYAVLAIWLGLRLAGRGRIETPLVFLGRSRVSVRGA